MATDRSNLLTGLLSSGIVALIIVWGVTGLANGDPLWFVHRFDAQAQRFDIYWDGAHLTVSPDDAGYEVIMDAFAAAIASPAGFEGRVGFSEESRLTYQAKYRLLEVTFAEPIQVHTRHPYTKAATYLVPLDQTHALFRRVFAFPGTLPHTFGPLNMSAENFGVLLSAVEAVVNLATAD